MSTLLVLRSGLPTTGDGGGGAETDLTTFTFLNTSGSGQTEVPVHIPLSFAKGVVASSEKVVIYKADNTPADAQIDQIANWSDGSIMFCVARAWVPSVTGSGTYQFKIKKTTGSRSQSATHAVSDISGGWDIKAQFQNFKDKHGDAIGSGTYAASMNDNIANSLYTKEYASGPQALCVETWARTKDETGGAERFHHPTFFFAEIWRKPSGGDVLCVMANPLSSPWLTASTKTVGGIHYSQPRLLDGASELLNRNTSLLTFTDADCNTSTGVITKTAHGLQDGIVVRISTSGTLPGCLEAGQYYRVSVLSANTFRLIWNSGTGRFPNYATMTASSDEISNTSLGHSCRTGQPLRSTSNSARGLSDGVYFTRVLDDERITLHPTPADAIANTNKINFTGDGGFANDGDDNDTNLTPAGSGTHTLTLGTGSIVRSGYFLADSDGDPVWVGISKPTLIPALTNTELSYQISSGLYPPVDRTLTATVTSVPYMPNGYGPWRPGINDSGAHDMIGYWPGWCERTLINPTANGYRTVKTGGLVMQHVRRFMYLEDQQSSSVELAVPVTMNNGPSRNGTAYSGMGPIRKAYSELSPSGTKPARDGGPDGRWNEQTGQDASHWPMTAGAAYLMTGQYWFAKIHAMSPVRHFMHPLEGDRENTVGGTVYYNRIYNGEYQDRAKGWLMRDCGYAFCLPDSMVERAPLLDAVRDNMFRANHLYQNSWTDGNKNWGMFFEVTSGTFNQFMLKYLQAGGLISLYLADLFGTYPDLPPFFISYMKKLCNPSAFGLKFAHAGAAGTFRAQGGQHSVHGADTWQVSPTQTITFNSDHTCDRSTATGAGQAPLTDGDELIIIGNDYNEGGAGNDPPAGVSQLVKYYVGDVGVGGSTKFKLYTDEARTTQLTWGGGSASNVHGAYQWQSDTNYGEQDYARFSVGILVIGKQLNADTGLDTPIANAKSYLARHGSTGSGDLKWEYNL